MKPVLHPGLLLPTFGPEKSPIKSQDTVPDKGFSSVVSGKQLLDTLSNGLKDKTLLGDGHCSVPLQLQLLGLLAVCQLSAWAAATSFPIGYALLLFHNIRFLG